MFGGLAAFRFLKKKFSHKIHFHSEQRPRTSPRSWAEGVSLTVSSHLSLRLAWYHPSSWMRKQRPRAERHRVMPLMCAGARPGLGHLAPECALPAPKTVTPESETGSPLSAKSELSQKCDYSLINYT